MQRPWIPDDLLNGIIVRRRVREIVPLRFLEFEYRDRIAGLVIAPKRNAQIEDRHIAAVGSATINWQVRCNVLREIQALVETMSAFSHSRATAARLGWAQSRSSEEGRLAR